MPSLYSSQYDREREAKASPTEVALTPPAWRRLRGYAFDPSLSLRLETASINQTIFRVRWEHSLSAGPCGEYLEVLDYDPPSACWYEPIDLNARELIAQDGAAPSEGNPQFHQQMVYAVAMNTIAHFERALGRQIFWASRFDKSKPRGQQDIHVPTLRLYPHALRAANAYYSPQKIAILFGYFPGPAGMVFACLSHDIVAHEITHALLDGMHRRYIEDNNSDTLAFHEAFADIVALFQHFTFPEVLRHQIARTRGDLTEESLLGELAQQFGEATGSYGALRSAIGERDANGKWRPLQPDQARLARAREPHERGSILVAAIFGAFLSVYKLRAQDLLRLATAGTGVLPPGQIHPDLVARLAREANKTAEHFLNICIRALDYCPPVDITFGDYLRAVVTSDFDMVPTDDMGYRVAIIESFRRWGIVPRSLRALSEEQLRWPFAKMKDPGGWEALTNVAKTLRPKISATLFLKNRDRLFEELSTARRQTHTSLRTSLSDAAERRVEFERVTGLDIYSGSNLEGDRQREKDSSDLTFEVHAVRPALRVSPDGTIMKQMIMILAQRRTVRLDPAEPDSPTFDFRGGSTLIFDLEGNEPSLRYAITRPIGDQSRLAEIREYRTSKDTDFFTLRETYFGRTPSDTDPARADDPVGEPFAILHADP